ncbi:MAG: hypothetical protein WDO70_10735 [Alphaproteobacteria bacterium]
MLDNKTEKKLGQWVTSLAITVIGCAAALLLFTFSFLDSQIQMAALQARVETAESRLDNMRSVENHLLQRLYRMGAPKEAVATLPSGTVPNAVPVVPVEPTVPPTVPNAADGSKAE